MAVDAEEVTNRPDDAPAAHDGVLRRALSSPSLRAALYPFALSRVVVFLILIVGGQIGHIKSGDFETTRDFYLHINKTPVARLLRETVQAADINWYLGIAELGYHKEPFNTDKQRNWAFFPLFPLLWRAASRLTGEFVITGIVLVNIFFFFALVVLHKTARAFGLDEADARRSLFYLAVFPVSYFFSLPLTESLFLLLTTGSFLAAKRERWWLAGLIGALASATRVTGVLLFPTLLVLALQTYGRNFWRRPQLLGLCLIPAGLLSFMYYLYMITGNPLAFKDILVRWGRSTGFFLLTFWQYLQDPTLLAIPWDFRVLNFAASVVALGCGIVLLKRRQWALGCYATVCMIVSLSSLILQSQARYASVLFPVFMVLAVAGGRRPRVDELIRVASLVLLTLMTALYAAHFSMAMS